MNLLKPVYFPEVLTRTVGIPGQLQGMSWTPGARKLLTIRRIIKNLTGRNLKSNIFHLVYCTDITLRSSKRQRLPEAQKEHNWWRGAQNSHMLTPNLVLKGLSHSDTQGIQAENGNENHCEKDEMNQNLPADRRESGWDGPKRPRYLWNDEEPGMALEIKDLEPENFKFNSYVIYC